MNHLRKEENGIERTAGVLVLITAGQRDRRSSLVVSGVRCLVDGQVSGGAGQVWVGSVVQQQLNAGGVS